MCLTIQDALSLDIDYLYGQSWSVREDDLKAHEEQINRAAKEVSEIRRNGKGPDGSHVFFPHLPYLYEENLLIGDDEKQRIKTLSEKAKEMDAVVSIGIGGSYLGNQVLFDLFCGPYWNMKSKEERHGFPAVFFAGQNVDPVSLLKLTEELKRRSGEKDNYKVTLLVISKSGTTIEPTTAFHVLMKELSGFCDVSVIAVTDAEKGELHRLALENNWDTFTVPGGIGGRFSIFSPVGLVFGSLIGLDTEEFLRGARTVEEFCQSEKWDENPALLLASLKYIGTSEYGLVSEEIMPYGDALRSLGWWYAQLLGESLGKKYNNDGQIVHAGRTPVAAVGTTDMHSLTQEHQQGKKNKLFQFISVDSPSLDTKAYCMEGESEGFVQMSRMLTAAMKSNAEALASEQRMSCRISVSRMTPYHLGALMYFFFLTIAYEGSLLQINAFDQPGVEAYKKILHQYLRSFLQ